MLARKLLAEEELKERMRITESLENEILEMSSVLGQMNDSIKKLSVDRDALLMTGISMVFLVLVLVVK
jgi:kinesin family protein 15